MKKLALLFLLTATAANATVITVSNAPNSPAQFTDLQLAINAANNGDTIYVSGSSINYGDIHINKQLVLFGAGFNPQKEFPLASTLNNIFFDTISNFSGASGSILSGFFWQQQLGNGTPSNIKLSRNIFTHGNALGNNWLIENNVVWGSMSMNNYSSIVIRNNIINNGFGGYQINTSNQPNLIVNNNLFLGGGSLGTFYGVTNAVIINNIFYGKEPTGASLCTFNNNLTYAVTQSILPYGSNIGASNMIGQDPQFTSIQTVNYNYNSGDNYRLLPTSPGHNAGTDGTDIGPYGGFNPFPSSPIGGEPRIPQVKNMNINNSNLPLNGNLNINVKGKKQD